jgi:hypothetical protein
VSTRMRGAAAMFKLQPLRTETKAFVSYRYSAAWGGLKSGEKRLPGSPPLTRTPVPLGGLGGPGPDDSAVPLLYHGQAPRNFSPSGARAAP